MNSFETSYQMYIVVEKQKNAKHTKFTKKTSHQKNLSTQPLNSQLPPPPLFFNFGLAAKRNINFERPWVILKPMKEENVFNKKCSELGNMMCIYIPYLHWSLKWFLYFGTSPYIELLIVCIGSNFINTTGFLVIFLVWKSLKIA